MDGSYVLRNQVQMLDMQKVLHTDEMVDLGIPTEFIHHTSLDMVWLASRFHHQLDPLGDLASFFPLSSLPGYV